MQCYSCGKQKNQLFPKKSAIIKGMGLLMCQSCIDLKYEPKYIIILGGRVNGFESVKDYISKHRYVGTKILAEELAS